MAADRIRTVEKDQAGGWIARSPHTGEVILGDDFRWNCRESARCAVWEARHLSKPKDKSGVGLARGGQPE